MGRSLKKESKKSISCPSAKKARTRPRSQRKGKPKGFTSYSHCDSFSFLFTPPHQLCAGSDPGILSIYLDRLLYLASKKEILGFKDIYRSFCKSVGTSGFDIDSFTDKTYNYLSGFIDLFEDGDGVARALKLYFFQSFRVFFDAVCSFSRIHGCHIPDVRDYFILHVAGLLHPCLKYQTCVQWCRFMGHEELPENPHGFPTQILGFGFNLDVRRRLRDQEFQYSLFMGLKKALHPLSPYDLFKDLYTHKERMTSRPTAPSEDIELFPGVKLEGQRSRIMRYIGQLPKPESSSLLIKPFQISTNASFAFGRAEKGSYHELVLLLERVGLLPSHKYLFRPEHLIGVRESDKGFFMFERAYLDHGLDEILEAWKTLIALPELPYLHTNKRLPPFQREYELGWDRVARTTPYGIFEPSKVRMITKGDSLTRNFLDSLKDLLRFPLTKLSCFRPTCRTFDDEWVRQLDKANPSLKWVSGDYSAATDLANMEISRLVYSHYLGECGDKLIDLDLYRLGLRSLSSNRIEFGDYSIPLPGDRDDFRTLKAYKLKEFGESYLQTNGQLMGSVISFPILCLMNLFAYWTSCEIYFGIDLDLNTLLNIAPVLINGDDILFKSDNELYQIWKNQIKLYGFVPSKGKNLFTSEGCTINSRLYLYDKGELKKVDYFNHGLINGMRKGISIDRYDGTCIGETTDAEHYFRLRAYYDSKIRNYKTDREFLLYNRNLPIVPSLENLDLVCKQIRPPKGCIYDPNGKSSEFDPVMPSDLRWFVNPNNPFVISYNLPFHEVEDCLPDVSLFGSIRTG